MKRILLSILLAYSSLNTAQNLVAHYDFDLNYNDQSTSQNHLTSFDPLGNGGSIGRVLGYTGNQADSAVFFQAGEGLVSQQTDNIGWTQMAISFWVRSADVGQVIQGAYIGFGISIGWDVDHSTIQCFFDGTSAGQLHSSSIAPSISAPVWRHIVCQNNGTTTEIYIDGQLDTSHTESFYAMTTPNTDAKYYVGILNNGNLPGQHGLDELKIFDTALTQQQISDLYNGSSLNLTEELEAVQLDIYPNPSSDLLNIRSAEQIEKIEIVGQDGRIITNEFNSSTILNISNLQKGMYFIRITIAEEVITRRFIKK